MDGFARAVDAAVGVEIGVDRPGRRPAADPAVGQVEGGTPDFEEIEVAAGAVGHHRVGLVAAAAMQYPARDAGDPVGVARRRGKFAVVAGIELQRDAADRLGTGQRAHCHRRAVAAGIAGQAEIGDEHPIGRGLGAVALLDVGALDGREIHAGAFVMQHVL